APPTPAAPLPPLAPGATAHPTKLPPNALSCSLHGSIHERRGHRQRATVVITRQRGPARVPVEPRLVRPQKQRIALHRPVLKSAIITFNQRVSSAPCLVRDLSSTGARLRVEGTIHVPNSFDVIIDLDAGLVRTIAQGMLADHDMAQAQGQPNASRRLLSTRQARPDRGRTYAQPLQQLTPSSALAKQCWIGIGRSFPHRLLKP